MQDTLLKQLIYEFGYVHFWMLLLIFLVLSLFTSVITTYLVTRSKNLAQKKDIEDLTRKAEAIKSDFQKNIESLRHEHSLIDNTYRLFVKNIIEYYSFFYQHYIKCSRTVNYDIYIPKGSLPLSSSDIFEEHLENFSIKWNNQLGKVKLLFPDGLLELHTKIELQFNEFRDIVMNREKYLLDKAVKNSFNEEYKNKLKSIFSKINECKNKIEKEIRNILKINKLGYE